MDHVAHLRKKVSINKHICAKLWLYHKVDKKTKKINISFLRPKWSFICKLKKTHKKTHQKNPTHTHTNKNKTRVLFAQVCFAQSLVVIGPLVLEKKIFLNFGHVIFLFRYMCINSPWKNACHFIWITTQGCFVQRFFFKWTQEFSFVIFFRYIPLNKPGSHSANDALCQVWLKSSL